MEELLNIKEASIWASKLLGKCVSTANISYLLNYGRIEKIGKNGSVLISKKSLLDYYEASNLRESAWKNQLGNDLNWALSFEQFTESQTTKHVHRLHPYKGKFIPQLVEYFLDAKTDDFKTDVFFKKGDIVLDPFCGSGTTLVQAAELGIHAVGVDISAFNALISNVKVQRVDFYDLNKEITRITEALRRFVANSKYIQFENRLVEELNKFNNEFFPSPEFKIRARKKEINEREYATQKEREFLPVYEKLLLEFGLKNEPSISEKFLEKWFLQSVRDEISFVFGYIKGIENTNTKKVLSVILSRTIRSCRATTHADLATLIAPITKTYYCAKHGKICKPLFSIVSWWERYSKDTLQRLGQFADLREKTYQFCLSGNSETIDIFAELDAKFPTFGTLARTQKIKGIFSSPPYVGLIDYHEQHAYAYDLFGFERRDAQEIGALFKKQSKPAQQDYANGISNVLNNCKKFLAEDFDIFLVANDKYNLYPQIAENSDLRIVNQYKRPVLNRTEKDKGAYSEIIFHLKRR